MPTHVVPCVVCGHDAACCYDQTVLGCGAGCYDESQPKIEFCSVRCFRDLQWRMAEREEFARAEYPGLFDNEADDA